MKVADKPRVPGHWRRALGCLALAMILLSGGCASTGSTPQPFPRPGASPSPTGLPALPEFSVVETALSLQGVPYQSGGADPGGFDCSGFVSYVFAQHKRMLPRTVPEQYRLGRPVGGRSVQPGDLVFFSTVAKGPTHVGIAISRDEFVHAPSSAGVVRVEGLRSRYWSSRFLGARRLP